MRFGASGFVDPPWTRFRNKIEWEQPEARISDLNNPEAHLMHSFPLNRLKRI